MEDLRKPRWLTKDRESASTKALWQVVTMMNSLFSLDVFLIFWRGDFHRIEKKFKIWPKCIGCLCLSFLMGTSPRWTEAWGSVQLTIVVFSAPSERRYIRDRAVRPGIRPGSSLGLHSVINWPRGDWVILSRVPLCQRMSRIRCSSQREASRQSCIIGAPRFL